MNPILQSIAARKPPYFQILMVGYHADSGSSVMLGPPAGQFAIELVILRNEMLNYQWYSWPRHGQPAMIQGTSGILSLADPDFLDKIMIIMADHKI